MNLNPFRTLMWVTVRLHTPEHLERLLFGQTPGLADPRPIKSAVREFEWHWPLPARGDEVCLTDLTRTRLKGVEWWPADPAGPVRVLQMEPVLVSDEGDFQEILEELRPLGAVDPYAPTSAEAPAHD